MQYSEFCDIDYREEYNVVVVTWKKYCCNEDYREAMYYALQFIERYGCCYVSENKGDFPSTPEDTEWLVKFFLPRAIRGGCNCIYHLVDRDKHSKKELSAKLPKSSELLQFKVIYELEEILE